MSGNKPSNAYPSLIVENGHHNELLFLDIGKGKDGQQPFAILYRGDTGFRFRPAQTAVLDQGLQVHAAATRTPPEQTERCEFVTLGKMYDDVLPYCFFSSAYHSSAEAIEQVEYFLTIPENDRYIWVSGTEQGGFLVVELSKMIELAADELDKFSQNNTAWQNDVFVEAMRFVDISKRFVRYAGAKISPFKPGTRLFTNRSSQTINRYTAGNFLNGIALAVENLDAQILPTGIDSITFAAVAGALKHSYTCMLNWLKSPDPHPRGGQYKGPNTP